MLLLLLMLLPLMLLLLLVPPPPLPVVLEGLLAPPEALALAVPVVVPKPPKWREKNAEAGATPESSSP